MNPKSHKTITTTCRQAIEDHVEQFNILTGESLKGKTFLRSSILCTTLPSMHDEHTWCAFSLRAYVELGHSRGHHEEGGSSSANLASWTIIIAKL